MDVVDEVVVRCFIVFFEVILDCLKLLDII